MRKYFCVIPGCQEYHKEKVVLFKFPTDETAYAKWDTFARSVEPSWSGPPQYRSAICSVHFDVDNFIIFRIRVRCGKAFEI